VTGAHGTPRFRGTPIENHCTNQPDTKSIPNLNRTTKQHPAKCSRVLRI